MKSGKARYGSTAKVLHWVVAALIAAQFAVGFTMPDIERDTKVDFWINLHFSIGVLIILAAVLRIVWRVLHPVPVLAEMPKWQQHAAHATHGILYLLIAVAPLLGWANASSRGWDVSLFGFYTLPRLTVEGSGIGDAMGDVHVAAVFSMLALIGLHVLAALYHHFVQRDQVLREML